MTLLQSTQRPSQFDALSKVLDADELGALLRITLRIDERTADGGYSAALLDGPLPPPAVEVGSAPEGPRREGPSGGGPKSRL